MCECGDEGVGVVLGDGVFGEVELALDAAEVAGGGLAGDDVDADVADIAFLGPFVEQPDVGEAVGVEGIGLEVGDDEALEAVAEVARVCGGLAKVFQKVVKGHGRRGRVRVW